MKNVLIVCTANKTRSPLAMEVANRIAADRGLPYCFKSAGIAAIGVRLDENVVRVLAELGIETEHTPTHISVYNINDFDEIHVMTERQRSTLIAYFKGENISDKIKVLNIDDPFYDGIDAYRECRDKLIKFYGEYIK